ncbi:MAG TPA: hypothetical protein VI386_17960 [Candidatus Sulfotelmatobacter sp.]
MSIFKALNVRPVRNEDLAQLDRWRRSYPDAFLELPHGVAGPGVETACAEKDGKLIGSLTAVSAVVMDPFIHDPAVTGADVYGAVLMLERALAYKAQPHATDAYIAIPSQIEKSYGAIVEKSGYIKTCENCTIYRRALRPDTVGLIEHGN